MTPNERACLILSAWSPILRESEAGAEATDESLAELGVMIESQIDESVTAEREACAVMVDDALRAVALDWEAADIVEKLAATIRARSA